MPYDEAGLLADPDFQAASVARQAQMLGQARSEERRVGKECRL